MTRRIAAITALVAFAVCILVGLQAQNPFATIVSRALVAMVVTFAVGLVLGARTFSQQGMFLAGGLLADRWGARRAILLGCLVRISGYAVLAAASNFSLFLLGAVLTGAGGALFSPALRSSARCWGPSCWAGGSTPRWPSAWGSSAP